MLFKVFITDFFYLCGTVMLVNFTVSFKPLMVAFQ